MFRSILTVLKGTVLAQLIAVIAIPLISRTYSPTEFGEFQLFFSTVALLLPLASWRLEYAILRLRRPDNLIHLILLCLAINLLMSALLYAGVLIAGPYFGAITLPLWLLPLSYLCAGLFQTLAFLPLREHKYKLSAQSKVVQSGTFNIGAVSAGFMMAAPSALTLLLLDMVSRVFGALLIGSNWWANRPKKPLRRVPRILSAMLGVYRDFPIYAVPSGIVSGLAQALPVFALTAIYSLEVSGQFSMAWRVALMPIGMVTYAISGVVSGHVAQILRDGTGGVITLIFRLCSLMFLIGLVPSLVIFWEGEWLAVAVLGDQWSMAGQMIAALAPMMLSAVVMGPVNTVLFISGRQNLHMMWEIVRAAVLLGTFWAASASQVGPVTAVAWYGMAVLIMNVAFVVLIVRVSTGADSAPAARPSIT